MIPRIFTLPSGAMLTIKRGDITAESVDAIVNAANVGCLGGGGADGAIHRAAGPRLLAACRALAEVEPGVRCPTGEARITPGFGLSARHVIHAVGPIYRSQDESAPLLTSAYRSALALANTHSFDSLAFVAISCGIFGYPLDAAAELALDAVASGVGQLRDVRFVFLDANAHDAWLAAATKRFGED